MNQNNPRPLEVIFGAAVRVLREPGFQQAPRHQRVDNTLYHWIMYYDTFAGTPTVQA